MVGWQRCLRSVLRQVNTMMERNGRSSAIGYDACTKLYSPGQFAHPWIVSDISSSRIGRPSYQYLQHLVEVVMGLEEAFGITVEEDSAQSIVTVQDAADLIEDLVCAKST